MSLKIKLKQLVLIGVLALSTSCMDDLGNYDYQEINDIEINDIEDDYVVKRFENLTINPDLQLSQDVDGTGEYVYRWVAVRDNGLGVQEKTEIATSKNLDEPISLITGKYLAYYFVKDLKTGVERQYKFNIEVVDSIYTGWLVLSDVADDTPRLDMLSLIDGEYKPIYNVLEGSGLELSGEGKFVYTYGYDPNFYGVYVSTTGNGTTKIHPDTFEWSKNYTVANEFITAQPNDLELDSMATPAGGQCFALFGGNAYYYNRTYSTAYSSPINIINGERFEVSPMFGKSRTNKYVGFYDTTNKRFVRYYNQVMSTFAASASVKFDYNNTGKDLVYFVSNDYGGYKGTAMFAILKDPATSKNYLAVFNISNSAQLYYGEINDDKFNQASHIAIDPVYGYVFYNVGSKVYKYDWSIENPVAAEEVLDMGGDEITLLKFHDFWGSSDEAVTMQEQLMVGRFDGTTGTLESYDVPSPSLGGNLTKVTSYTGFGKIKSVNYRERL